jgi:uncharacterized protein (UPF0147 family)|tara:strand:+ start:989 stop:1750 length:762 start_codon:yes stop_codon:yes gene_type:complete
MKQFLIFFFFLSAFTFKAQNDLDYSQVSKDLLQNIMNDTSYEKEVRLLAESSLDELINELKTDKQKTAFWVNVYNAFIQISLTENPSLYKDKGDFFSKERIEIAGEILSFDDIEHGIIRKSKIKLGLGYLPKWFVSNWERDLRVKNMDWRIHFALNCGAKSCPPVAVYSSENLNKELDFMTKEYLKEQTTYDNETKKAKSVVLMSWFRGDFGGISGAKKILFDYKITPDKPRNLDFKSYDWTLLLKNYRTIPK